MTQEEAASQIGCCGPPRQSRKVTPVMSSQADVHFIEIRPGRRISIYHRNPRPRDPGFQNQFESYLQNVRKKKGLRSDKSVEIQQVKQLIQAELSSNSHSYSNHGLNLDDENLPEKAAKNGLTDKAEIHRSMSHAEWMLNFKNSPNRYLSNGLSSPSHAPKHNSGFPAILDSPMKVHNSGESARTEVPNTSRIQTAQLISDHVDVNTLKHISLEKYQSGNKTNKPADLEKSLEGQGHGKSPPFKAGSREDSVCSNTIKAGTDEGCVFLLHGVGGSAAVWKAQDEYFTERNYEVIIPDLLGHGNSSAPINKGDYEFKEIAADVLTIFDRFCKKRNVIIGHSYGCSFAVKLCRQRAKWINKLIMVSGGSPSPLAPQPGIFSLPLCLLCCCQHVLSRGFNKSAFHSKKSFIPQKEAFDVPPHVLKFTMNGQNWPEGGVEYHMSLNIPTLIIHGEGDKFVSLEEEQEMRQVVYGSELVVVKEASHMVMLEQPDIVNELIEKFMCKSAPLPGSTTQHLVQEGIDLIQQQQQPKEVNSPQRLVSPRRSLSAKFRRSSRPAVSTLNGSQLSLRSVKTIPANLVTANLP